MVSFLPEEPLSGVCTRWPSCLNLTAVLPRWSITVSFTITGSGDPSSDCLPEVPTSTDTDVLVLPTSGRVVGLSTVRSTFTVTGWVRSGDLAGDIWSGDDIIPSAFLLGDLVDLAVEAFLSGDEDLDVTVDFLAGDFVFGVAVFFVVVALGVFFALPFLPLTLSLDRSTTQGVVLAADFFFGDFFLLAGELVMSITDLAPGVFLFGVFCLLEAPPFVAVLEGVVFFAELLAGVWGVFLPLPLGGVFRGVFIGVFSTTVGLLILMNASRVFFWTGVFEVFAFLADWAGEAEAFLFLGYKIKYYKTSSYITSFLTLQVPFKSHHGMKWDVEKKKQNVALI